MDLSILQESGLTKGEARVYIILLEIGTTKVGPLIEKTALASSAVHNAVHTLTEKGLVSYIKKGKIKYYQAASPEQIIDFMEEKKKKIMQVLPELKLKQKLSEEKQSAEVFEGIKGITAMLNILIEDTKPKDAYLFFAIDVDEQNEEIQKFLLNYDLKRKEKKLDVKGITSPKLKPFFIKRKILKMKYSSFPIPSNISICNGKLVLFSWGEKPVGYLIHSRQLAEKYTKFFHEMWGRCK